MRFRVRVCVLMWEVYKQARYSVQWWRMATVMSVTDTEITCMIVTHGDRVHCHFRNHRDSDSPEWLLGLHHRDCWCMRSPWEISEVTKPPVITLIITGNHCTSFSSVPNKYHMGQTHEHNNHGQMKSALAPEMTNCMSVKVYVKGNLYHSTAHTYNKKKQKSSSLLDTDTWTQTSLTCTSCFTYLWSYEWVTTLFCMHGSWTHDVRMGDTEMRKKQERWRENM